MLNHSEVPKLEAEMEKLERYWEENQLEGVEKFEWNQITAKGVSANPKFDKL